MKYIILLIFIAFTCCHSRNTNVFINNWFIHNNTNSYFFDDKTFGLKLYNNPCTIIKNNNGFRKFIADNIKCTGKWCLDGQWKCGKRGNKNCYHVEHIIDLKGPEFKNYPEIKRIAANHVMTWGLWNSALGGLANYNYTYSSHEKGTVYGIKIVEMVRQQINECLAHHKRDNIGDYENICSSQTECICDDIDEDCGCDCSAYKQNDNMDNNNYNITNFIFGAIISLIVLSIIISIILYGKMGKVEGKIESIKTIYL